MADMKEGLRGMNTAERLSRELQGVAATIDATLRAITGQNVKYLLITYTPPRANYIGTATREENVAMVTDILNRWSNGETFIPSHPSELYTRIAPRFTSFLGTVHDVLKLAAGEPVAFSIFLADPPHPVMYGAKAARDQVKDELQNLLRYWHEGLPDIPAHEVM
jgi:hypothetical protein